MEIRMFKVAENMNVGKGFHGFLPNKQILHNGRLFLFIFVARLQADFYGEYALTSLFEINRSCVIIPRF